MNLNFTEDFLSELTPQQAEKLKKQYLTNKIIDLFSDADFVASIDAFFDCNLNVSLASKTTFMHRNTLAYRIKKVERITGLNIKNFSDAFTFKILMLLYSSRV